ncbi:MAG: NUDIX domain-containing protein [Chlorobiota bacterium]|jgi:8-oxo-dGTP pyrophosphatase MutT (NUDIX family)|nr:MAG: NUDIX domain-containing protein [Chlorobiota bacterium]
MGGKSELLVQVHVVRPTRGEWQHVVLRRRQDDGEFPALWQVITGRPTSDESPFDAAQRELAEETQLTALEWWSLPLSASFYDVRRQALVFVAAFGAVVAPDAEPHLTEHSTYRWLRARAAAAIVAVPAHQEGVAAFDYLLTEQHRKPQLRQLYCIVG